MRKRALTLVLALAVCCGLCVPALAANPVTVSDGGLSITISDVIWEEDVTIDYGYEEGVVEETYQLHVYHAARNAVLTARNDAFTGDSGAGFTGFELKSGMLTGGLGVDDGGEIWELGGENPYPSIFEWYSPSEDEDTSTSVYVLNTSLYSEDESLRVQVVYMLDDGKASIADFLGAGEQSPAKPEKPVEQPASAAPTASTVLVNGEKKSFDAYNIEGNNYFKLRDLAYVLSGTDKQFEVGWNAAANAISLTSGAAYTAVGGEMTGGVSGAQTAVPSASKILLDGKEVSLTAYTINGNNYFKLRDIGQTFDFGVGWDGGAQTISIDTSIGYTAE